MGEHRIHGRSIDDSQIQAWADAAETGYEPQMLRRPRRGRPPLGAGPATTVSVRLDEKTLAALMKRARDENISSRSTALRAAIEAWTNTA